MKKINFKKDVLPHLIAIVVFYVVTIAFFSPVIFENKSLPQHDITQAAGGSHELKEYYDKTGEVTLWTNSMFGGMPTYLMGVEYTGELTVYIHKIFGLFLPQPVRLLFIAFICCYIMLVSMGVRPWLAIAGGLAFGFTDFSIIGIMAGHNAKVGAVAYMPLVFAGVYLAFAKNKIWGFVLTALGLALQLRANHLQITYFLLIIIIIFGISQLVFAVKEKTLLDFAKTTGILVIAALLAIGCNFGRIWTVTEYSKYSTRGKKALTSVDQKKSGLDKEYAFQYSNGIMEPLFLFIPNFFGGSGQQDLGKNSNLEEALRKNGANRQQIQEQVESAPAYWGEQPMTAPYYAGSIVVFLFVLSLLVLDKKYKYWVIATVILGIMLSWGKNFSMFNNFIFDYLPGYNKFRSVTFTIIIPVFAMVMSGFIALEKTMTDWNKATEKKFLMALAITGGFALLCILFAGMGGYRGAIDERLAGYPAWYMDALRADRASLLRSDAFRSLFFVVAFAAVVWFVVKQKLSALLGGALMILLVLIDMFGVSKRFINNDIFVREKSTVVKLTEADKAILKDKELSYRVMNVLNPFNDGETSYYHHSVGGYHGAKMGRYQELIENTLNDEHTRIFTALQKGNSNFGKTEVLNMLNTRYLKFGDAASAILPMYSTNGNAWFVSEVIKVDNADQEMEALKTLSTKTTAVVDQSLFEAAAFEFDSLSDITLVDYQSNKLTYTSKSSTNSFAVFSEIYYPEGWQVTIDGQSVEMIRVNYVLRGLNIPAGEHQIVFEFAPKSYYIGNKVSMASSVVLIILLLGAVFQSLKSTNEEA